MNALGQEELIASVNALQLEGSQRRAAKRLGISQSTLNNRLQQAKQKGLMPTIQGRVEALESKSLPLPAKGQKKVYILTCAQDHTHLHQTCWKNLLALASHYDAQILVSTFKYNKDALGQREQSKFETREAELAALYPKEIIPYVCDERVDIAPNLTFCGELNVLPTAVNPLEGLNSYTYRKSTIVPHPKLAMQSVPTMKSEGVKLMMTTGCVTQRNYIKRKVGFKAEHFHSYGALIVEVNDKGHWYPRQLQLGPDDAIYDKDTRAYKGKVTSGHRVEDITWGDVHAGRLDTGIADISWGKRADSMLEVLRPRQQHVHDLLDFSGRSHHTRKDPHATFKSHLNGEWILIDELELTASVLWDDIVRPWCETYVVDSNHNRHLDRYLKEIDWREDPANARLVLSLNLKILDSIADGTDGKLSISEYAIRFGRARTHSKNADAKTDPHVRFLLEDESHVILPDIEGGIECGLHCDRGANGAKGTIVGIANTDRRVNGADKHTVAIMNHAYFCGTSGRLEQGWNHGLSSWTHAHTVTYANGTRAIYSIWKGDWQA